MNASDKLLYKMVEKLGITLTNAEAISILRKIEENAWEVANAMVDNDEPYSKVKEKVKKAMAYNVVVRSFEDYLNHDDRDRFKLNN